MNIFLTVFLVFNSYLFSQKEDDQMLQYRKLMEQALKYSENLNQNIDLRIERLRGSVKVISNTEEQTDLLDNYQYPLEVGDTIKTGPDGTVDIYINDIGVIRIEKNSEFEVEDISDELIFSLNFGSLVSKIEKTLKKKFSVKIRTPSAVCGIRGTEFAIEHSKFNNESIFGVFDEGELIVWQGEEESDENAIKISKNSEVIINPQSKRQRVVKMQKLLRFKNYLLQSKQKLLLYKKRWKRFDDTTKQKYRNMLFKKKVETINKSKKPIRKKTLKHE